MATAKGTESLKISAELLNIIREIASREDRTVRAQLERYVRIGLKTEKKSS